MIRYTLAIIAILAGTVAARADSFASITCYFQSGEHFTVVGGKTEAMIQWDDGKYYPAAVTFEDPWLMVVERSEQGNLFKMAFNARTKEAFGETTFTNGTKKGGPLWCAFK